MMAKRFALFLFVVGLMVPWAVGAPLVPCPDCGREVSSRAVVCPGCGCPGAAIQAETKKDAEEDPPKIPDRLLVATVNGENCFALPVRMRDGLFAVLPLEKTFGLSSLEFSFFSTNQTIAYSVPDVALKVPVIRFPITETNLLFWTVSSEVDGPVFDANAEPPEGTTFSAIRSSATGESADYRFSPVLTWKKVQPRDLKIWGNALREISVGKASEIPASAHPYYLRLAKTLQQEKEIP